MSIRSKAPQIHPIQSLQLPEPQVHRLDNGIPVYEIALGTQDILRVELNFKAGRWYEPRPMVARAAARMIKLGTLQHNAEALADYFDFYGTKLGVEDDFDGSRVTLYCLTKHLEPLLAMLQECLTQPAFPEEDFHKFVKREKQRLKAQLQENDVVAYRTFTEAIFGKDHPYGYNSSPEYWDALDMEELKNFFRQQFVANRCMILVSGKTNERVLALLNQYLGVLPNAANELNPPIIAEYPTHIPTKIHQPSAKEGSLQASLRIGRRLFPRQHPDFHGLNVLNTILGGYFGARLMQNLREENGYTYGIYSTIETFEHDAYFYIASEVGNEVKEAALVEIYSEIERLKNEAIPAEELEMVRSYTLGMLLNGLDGAFKVSAIWRELLTVGLSSAFFYEHVNVLRTITPEELQRLAQVYLTDLCEVVVG